MTIGTITEGSKNQGNPSDPIFVVDVSFTGDTSYPSDGTPGFQALVNAAVFGGKSSLEILAIMDFSCGQYIPYYDKDNDKLLVFDGGHATWNEVGNGTNLGGTTFNLTVLMK